MCSELLGRPANLPRKARTAREKPREKLCSCLMTLDKFFTFCPKVSYL